jgi:hypothetical protein
MLTQFEAGGLHPGMAYVLDGEPASTSPEHALVLVGSPCARVRSGVKSGSAGFFTTCPLFSLTTDIRRGERHIRFVPDSEMHHCIGAKPRPRQMVTATCGLSFPRCFLVFGNPSRSKRR